MVAYCMVFGVVVGSAGWSRSPVKIKMLLVHSVFYPVKAHIKSFGSFLLHSNFDESSCDTIISLDWCGGLGMAHVHECCSHHFALLTVFVKRSYFGFKRISKDISHYIAENVDWLINHILVWWMVWEVVFVGEVKITGSLASRSLFNVIGCVRVDDQDHVTCYVPDNGIRVCGAIVE